MLIHNAALIGDLVASREQADRRRTQYRLVEVLSEVSGIVAPVQALAPTIGDEFQAVYRTIGQAVLAASLVRLRLREVVDCRFGLGVGELEVFDDGRAPTSQDGPAWWAARDAIVEVKELAGRRGYRELRTWARSADDAGPAVRAEVQRVNAFLMCRDAAVAALTDRGDRLLFGLLCGRSQAALAAEEGVTRSAVAQYVGRNNLAMQAAAHRLMAGSDS